MPSAPGLGQPGMIAGGTGSAAIAGATAPSVTATSAGKSEETRIIMPGQYRPADVGSTRTMPRRGGRAGVVDPAAAISRLDAAECRDLPLDPNLEPPSRDRRAALRGAFLLALAARMGMTTPATACADNGDIVKFENSAFPFDGEVPATPDASAQQHFMQQDPDGRRFHISPRGGKLYEQSTYNDQCTLLYVPPQFDARRPDAGIVLFFHGNLATLPKDVVSRQGVPCQLATSGLNAVLVAPQLAVNALDSSAGHFYEPDFLRKYLHEAAERLAENAKGKFTAAEIDCLPVIIVAYSGGYVPTAYSLGDGNDRVVGVVLLDALFGEEPKFADWIKRRHEQTFFISAYSKASAPLNGTLAATLRGEHLHVTTGLPATLKLRDIAFVAALDAVHDKFVTDAWTPNPLAAILSRIRITRP